MVTLKQSSFEDDDYTPEETEQVFERAAQLQSQDVFAADRADLDVATLEKSAGRAGIDDKYVKQAVEELRAKEREAAEQKRLLEQARVARVALLKKIAVPAAIVVGLYLMIAYSSLNNKFTDVEKKQAQLENVLQRRHELVPNLIAASKFAAAHERETFDSLARLETQTQNAPDLEQRAKAENELSGAMREALNSLRDEQAGSKIFLNLSTQMEGAENRIGVERKRYNEAAAEYNKSARAFPLSLVRPLMGFPAQQAYFKADSAARETPKF